MTPTSPLVAILDLPASLALAAIGVVIVVIVVGRLVQERDEPRPDREEQSGEADPDSEHSPEDAV